MPLKDKDTVIHDSLSNDPPMISLQFKLQHYPGYIRLELN